jgi:cell division protein FtsW
MRSTLYALALAALCALQLACVLRAPSAWSPARIDVTLLPGESVVLGRQELGAPQADARHVGLRRDEGGRWWVHNASTLHPMLLQAGKDDHRTGSTVLAHDTRFQLGAGIFNVREIDGGMLELEGAGHRWRYDGAQLRRDGQVQVPCPDASLHTRLGAWWNRFAPRFAAIPRPLRLGGNLDCGLRLGLAGIALGSASINRGKAGFVLVTSGAAPVVLLNAGQPLDLAQQEEPLDQAASLVAGRTRFWLALDNNTLHLRPTRHVALSAQMQADLPPQVAWTWQMRDQWSLPALPVWQAGAAALAALLLALSCGWRAAAANRGARWRAFAATAGGPALACAGVAALVLQRLGMAPGMGITMLLAWSALWYALLAPRRRNLLVASAVLLLALGLLAQLELGIGAPDLAWQRHFDKTAALLAVGLGAGLPLTLARRRVVVPQARVEALVLLATALALAGLVLQVLLGDETGVFDLQPVEFAKLALAALAAHCVALAFGAPDGAGKLLRVLRFSAPAVLFVALLAVALVQVDDYSPLVLLLVWGGSLGLAWALAARQRLAGAVLAGAACAAVFAVVALRGAGVAELAHLDFYADRFMVWLDPATHPHTGQQLLLGAGAIAQGGWFGADHLFGLSTLGQAAGEALRIPAVQDDFAPSFFLNRHGLWAGLVMWALQALLLIALLRTAVASWQAGEAARDFRHAWLARFRCFALCGGAALLFGHFLLSWGTNLAIFPVMGQPMSFLSAGGSHLLFFICPLLVFGVASANVFEENNDAGLRPT